LPPASTIGGSVDVREANSYDFVRFCAASAVLFSHHFDLAGFGEPRVPGFGEDFGEVAVEVFFCLSGFLICRSLQKQPPWSRFVAARLLRVFPTLALVLVVSSAATFIWYRNAAHLNAHVLYVIDNLLMFARGVTFTIPGVFANAADPDVNNPIWTLPYELWCYVLLASAFAFGARRSLVLVVAAAIVLMLCWTFNERIDIDFGPLEDFEVFRLGSYFISGAVLAAVWPSIGRYAIALGFAGLIASVAARNLLPIDTPLTSLSLATCVIGLGSSGAMAWFGKGGDASYGMYVFAWPIQQFALLLIASFWLSLAVAFVVATAIGYACWHGYERRLMEVSRRLGRSVSAPA